MTGLATSTALKTVDKCWSASFAPPERINVREWADRYRYLSGEASSRHGKYSSSVQPLQREPMEMVDDPDTRGIVLMWPSQVIGKTEVLNNIIGAKIDQDPCPMLCVQPTLDMAQKWSKNRLAPMSRDTPRLKGKIRDPRARDSGNTVLEKTFPGGHITIAGANSPSSLSSQPIRLLILDEVDRFPLSCGTEGDPEAIAEKRLESYPDSITIRASTPTIEGQSRITAMCELSDKRHWFVDCPQCKAEHLLEWENIGWPDGKTEEAWIQCPKCKEKLNDEQRMGMIMRGRWKATAPFKGIRGYHANGLYCTFQAKRGYRNRLHQFAQEFLDHKARGVETLRVWINTFLCKTWHVDYESADPDPLLKRCEKYPDDHLPDGVLLLTVGADVQIDRIEATLFGWGREEECWCIEHKIFVGNTTTPQPWNDFDEWLKKTYKTAEGIELHIGCAAVDAGDNPKNVYAFTKPRTMRRIYSVKGVGGMGRPLVGRPSSYNRARAILFPVGTDCAKSVVMSCVKLERETDGPCASYVHFNKDGGFGKEYFKQLLAEYPFLKVVGSVVKREWKRRYSRNEGLDCFVYGRAALGILQPDFEALARRMQKKAAKVEAKPEGEADTSIPERAMGKPVASRLRPRRGGWVNRWR